MKIHGDERIVGGMPPQEATRQKNPPDKAFSAVLDETIGKVSKAEKIPEKPTTIDPIARIRLNPLRGADKAGMIARLENMLDLLEEYQAKLGDSRVSTKELYPLVRGIETAREELSPLLGSLPDEDELKEIANRALITASVEILKFERGDYLTP